MWKQTLALSRTLKWLSLPMAMMLHKRWRLLCKAVRENDSPEHSRKSTRRKRNASLDRNRHAVFGDCVKSVAHRIVKCTAVLCCFVYQPKLLLQCFVTLVEWQEGHPACKLSHTSNLQNFFFGRYSGIQPNLEWSEENIPGKQRTKIAVMIKVNEL